MSTTEYFIPKRKKPHVSYITWKQLVGILEKHPMTWRNVKKSTVRKVLDIFLEELAKSILCYDEVRIPRLGKFAKRINRPIASHMIFKTRMTVPVKAQWDIYFRAARSLKMRLGLTPLAYSYAAHRRYYIKKYNVPSEPATNKDIVEQLKDPMSSVLNQPRIIRKIIPTSRPTIPVDS